MRLLLALFVSLLATLAYAKSVGEDSDSPATMVKEEKNKELNDILKDNEGDENDEQEDKEEMEGEKEEEEEKEEE